MEAFLRAEWEVISSAPFSFVATLLALVSLGFLLTRWYYGKQLGDKNASIELKDTVIRHLEERLNQQEREISALKATIRELRSET